MLKRLFIILSVLSITACGGGGGGGDDPVINTTAADPDQTFSLATVNSTEVGTAYTFQLAGNDSDGNSLSGSISLAKRAQEMYDGILVTPADTLMNISGAGVSITATATGYVDTNGYLIAIITQTTGLVCTPVSPDKMPDSVKIGDFGILSTLLCNDSTTQERNWRITDGGNGTILLVNSTVVKNQFSQIVTTTDVTLGVDADGNIISIKSVTTDSPTGFTLTLQSV